MVMASPRFQFLLQTRAMEYGKRNAIQRHACLKTHTKCIYIICWDVNLSCHSFSLLYPLFLPFTLFLHRCFSICPSIWLPFTLLTVFFVILCSLHPFNKISSSHIWLAEVTQADFRTTLTLSHIVDSIAVLNEKTTWTKQPENFKHGSFLLFHIQHTACISKNIHIM